jgi:hypothetical protein
MINTELANEIEKFIEQTLNANPIRHLLDPDNKMKTIMLSTLFDKNDIEGFLVFFDNTTLLDAFLLVKDCFSDKKQEIDNFKDVWSRAEIQYRKVDVCKKLFLEYKESIMNEEELTAYKNLPENVTIYRGIRFSAEKDSGISWSLSKKTAEKFMVYPKGIYHEIQLGSNHKLCPNLRKKVVKKQDIICYLKNRQEDEIIYWEQ